MAARFTKGDSMATTRRTAQKGKVAEPRTTSHSLRAGSTMAGQPGFISTSANDGTAGAKGGKAMSSKPMKNRYIGHKGSSKMASSGRGTMGGRSAWMTRGSAGKVEKLAGAAKAFGERKGGKSNMY